MTIRDVDKSRLRQVSYISIDLECELSCFREFSRKLFVRQSFHFAVASIVSQHEKHIQLSRVAGGPRAGNCHNIECAEALTPTMIIISCHLLQWPSSK